MTAPEHCDLPPFGWRCTRAKGHEGPCAAVECPEDVAGVERGMKRWREGVARQEAGDTMDKWAPNVIDAALAAAPDSQGAPKPVACDPLDALRFGANVAEELLKIGRAIGFGRAQQILGEQWEAEHDCAPRGRMGVTVKDGPSRDAARYRWLRDFYVPAGARDDDWDDMDSAVCQGGKQLDAAIDSRLATRAAGQEDAS